MTFKVTLVTFNCPQNNLIFLVILFLCHFNNIEGHSIDIFKVILSISFHFSDIQEHSVGIYGHSKGIQDYCNAIQGHSGGIQDDTNDFGFTLVTWEITLTDI